MGYILALLIMATAPVKPAYTAQEISYAMTLHKRINWGDKTQFKKYAKLFVKYGNKWKVDSLLVACVAYTESRYHIEAPKLFRKLCKNKYVGCDKPGPCSRTKITAVCKRTWVNNQESGMMQVDNRWANNGYKACTGKTLTGNRQARIKKLLPPEVSICVGAKILSVYKKWAMSRKKRMIPRARRNKRHFNNYPGLRKFFWVSFYNWGPNKWRGNFYPRVVTSCWRRYRNTIKLKRQSARLMK